jgi:hypothetical protein
VLQPADGQRLARGIAELQRHRHRLDVAPGGDARENFRPVGRLHDALGFAGVFVLRKAARRGYIGQSDRGQYFVGRRVAQLVPVFEEPESPHLQNPPARRTIIDEEVGQRLQQQPEIALGKLRLLGEKGRYEAVHAVQAAGDAVLSSHLPLARTLFPALVGYGLATRIAGVGQRPMPCRRTGPPRCGQATLRPAAWPRRSPARVRVRMPGSCFPRSIPC